MWQEQSTFRAVDGKGESSFMIGQMLIFSIIVSMIYYEIVGISPGGLIAPGYVSIFLNDPKRIVMTLIIAVLTSVLVRVLSDHAIIYGKRRFMVCILISFILRYILHFINMNILFGSSLDITIVDAIGIIIPGIIANEIIKDGFINVTSSLFVVSIFIRCAWDIMAKVGVRI